MITILNWLFRTILAMVLLCITAFCTFGFLASFEPGNRWQWQVGYGPLARSDLVGAIAVLRRTRAKMLGALALFVVTMFCVLGFMESYLSLAGQVVYGALGCVCLTGGVALFGQKGNRNKPCVLDKAR